MMTVGVMEFEEIGKTFTVLLVGWMTYRYNLYLIEARMIMRGGLFDR